MNTLLITSRSYNSNINTVNNNNNILCSAFGGENVFLCDVHLLMANMVTIIAITSSDARLAMMIGRKFSIVNNYLYYSNMKYLTISAARLTFFDKKAKHDISYYCDQCYLVQFH